MEQRNESPPQRRPDEQEPPPEDTWLPAPSGLALADFALRAGLWARHLRLEMEDPRDESLTTSLQTLRNS